MIPSNPISDPVWVPSASGSSSTTKDNAASIPLSQTTSNPDEAKKRKGTSLLGGLTKKFSRKKSNPTPRISKEEIWKATSNHVHPNAAKLGMNTFNFVTGGSRDTRKGKVQERELSPGAVARRKGSSPSLFDEDLSPSRSSSKRSYYEDSERESDGERARHESGTSAYSAAARKRASGYVARISSSSASLRRETSYGSAQVAHFTSAYPRQIDTRVSTTSDVDMRSPVSSVGSSVQRDGSSVWDRSSSRWDSTATDVTTPDVCDRHSKSSIPGKGARGSFFDRPSEPQYSSAIVEEPEQLSLIIPENGDGASIKSTDAIHSPTPDERTSPAPKQKFSTADMAPAPFVPSDLQTHQCRVQDFSAGTHEVHNTMDMAFHSPSPHPRKHRKSVFLEMDDGLWMPVPQADEDTAHITSTDSGDSTWEETLRHLSITAVNGNTEFYSKNGSMPACSSSSSSQQALASVSEEESGSWAFGRKRSMCEDLPESPSLEKCGELPLHEESGEGLEGEAAFTPGHRRSRAVSLGRPRPKTIYVMPESGRRISGSYEQEDVELDEAVARDCRSSDGRSSADFFDIGEGLEMVEEGKVLQTAS